MVKIVITFLIYLPLILVNGCSPVGVIASGGATGMVVAEGDRSLGTVVDDATIKLQVSSKYLQSNKNYFININSNVIEGRVLLTGIVETQEIRIDAIKKVWEVEGVKEVVNEIEVGSKTTLKEYANDVRINAQVKSLALKTIGLRALSYNFETIRGRVYIAGITSRPEQLDSIIKVTKTIKGVKEIINYVIVKE